MPKITVPLDDTYNAITRPVLKMVADDVKRICLIDENTPLYMGGERGVTSQPGTRLYETERYSYGGTEKIYCVATEVMKDDTFLSTPVRNHDHTPFIYDYELGLAIRPVFIAHQVTLEFSYFARSKNAAERWRSEMAVRIAESRGALQHTVLYNLTLGDNILGLLHNIYTLRETIAGYGDTFHQWFERIQVVPFHAAGTLDGDVEKISIQAGSRQAHIQGVFEGDTLPNEVREDENVLWEISFSYKFDYLKPMRWFLEYPLMVHQQQIDEKYFDTTPTFSIDDLDYNISSKGWMALERIRWRLNGRSPQPGGGLRYPYYDEWIIQHDNVEGSQPVMNWCIALEPHDPTLVMDLMDLPDMDFSPSMIAYLKATYASLTSNQKALVKFTLWSGYDAMDDQYLEVTPDLLVRTTTPLSMRKVYHLRMSIKTDINKLGCGVVDTTATHPYAMLEMFQTLLPYLDVEWAAKYAIENGELDRGYIEWVMWMMELKSVGYSRISNARPSPVTGQFPMVSIDPNRKYPPRPLPLKDPGSFSGRNTPLSATPPVKVPFIWEDEDEPHDSHIPTLASPMTPTYDNTLPLLNVGVSMRTVQHLAIFVKKRSH